MVGAFGVAKLTAFLATDVGKVLGGTTSGEGLAGNFNFVGGLSVRLGFLVGGALYFTTRVGFEVCILTTGKTGGASETGVLGI